jgi:hypothetical protein
LGDLLGFRSYSWSFLHALEEIGQGEPPVGNCPFLEGWHEILEGLLVGDAVFSSFELGFLIAYRTGHEQEGSTREIRENYFRNNNSCFFCVLFFSGF